MPEIDSRTTHRRVTTVLVTADELRALVLDHVQAVLPGEQDPSATTMTLTFEDVRSPFPPFEIGKAARVVVEENLMTAAYTVDAAPASDPAAPTADEVGETPPAEPTQKPQDGQEA